MANVTINQLTEKTTPALADQLALYDVSNNSTKKTTIEDLQNTLNINSNLKNLVDGSAEGSVRGTQTKPESEDYTIGLAAFVQGQSTTASGRASHAEGQSTVATGQASHAEGQSTTASGQFSHAEGRLTEASGQGAHVEGSGTKASGDNSHAEGNKAEATNVGSHAEGAITKAMGYNSHAEGQNTTASGHASHTQNIGTIASKNYQTAIGKYNIEDTELNATKQKAFIIGNGTDQTRSNALTVDWQGNLEVSGDVSTQAGASLTEIDETMLIADDESTTQALTDDTLVVSQQGEITQDIEFTSADTELEPTQSVEVGLFNGNDTPVSKLTKISQMFKNIRYLFKRLGTTDISSIGDGSLTGAIDYLNQNTAFGGWSKMNLTLHNCTGTLGSGSEFYLRHSTNNRFVQIFGRVRIESFVRTDKNPGVSFTLPYTPTQVFAVSSIGYRAESPSEAVNISRTGNTATIVTTETYTNAQNGTLTLVIPLTTIYLP